MRIMRTGRMGTLCVLLAVLWAASRARAEPGDAMFVDLPKPLNDISRLQQPVAERADPQLLKAAPIRWRGFALYPQITFTQRYNDNLYASETNEEGDFISEVSPSLYVVKDAGRHKFDFSIEADAKQYWDNDNENVINTRAKIGALLEARHDLLIPLEVSYGIDHEKREQDFSGDITKDPLQYKTFSAGGGIAYKPNRLGVSLQGKYSDITFENGISKNTNLPVLRSNSDRSRYEGEAKISYDLHPNHTPFVKIKAGQTDYEQDTLDSKDIGAMAGWDFAYKGLIEARVAAGVTERTYDDSTNDDINALSAEAGIKWNVSKLATLNLDYKRFLQEDNDAVVGALAQQVRLGLDYEVMRNILLTTYVEQSWLDFENSPRKDEILRGGFGLRYVFNPYHSIGAEYDHSERESTSPGIDYDRDAYMIRYSLKF